MPRRELSFHRVALPAHDRSRRLSLSPSRASRLQQCYWSPPAWRLGGFLQDTVCIGQELVDVTRLLNITNCISGLTIRLCIMRQYDSPEIMRLRFVRADLELPTTDPSFEFSIGTTPIVDFLRFNRSEDVCYAWAARRILRFR